MGCPSLFLVLGVHSCRGGLVLSVTGSKTPAMRRSSLNVNGRCRRMCVRNVSRDSPAIIPTNSDSDRPVFTRRASWFLISTNSVNDCFGVCRVDTMSARNRD